MVLWKISDTIPKTIELGFTKKKSIIEKAMSIYQTIEVLNKYITLELKCTIKKLWDIWKKNYGTMEKVILCRNLNLL